MSDLIEQVQIICFDLYHFICGRTLEGRYRLVPIPEHLRGAVFKEILSAEFDSDDTIG